MKISFFGLLAGILVVAALQERHPQGRLADKIVFTFNENMNVYSAETLRFMSFGYARAMGALVWLRFLQQTPPKKVEKNEVSWIYRDLNSLSEIDPEFFPIYDLGGIFLSVITEDKRGAEQILLKGTRVFPERWRIRGNLGYHYQFELNEPEKAAEQYRIGAKLPGAPPLFALIASSFINSREGRERSIDFLEGMLRDTKDPDVRAKFLAKIEKLKKGGKANVPAGDSSRGP
jgi:hypothetical protein